MRAWLLRALALALIIMCLAATALAQSPTDQAWRLAVGFVPASALPLGMEETQEDLYTFRFEDALRGIGYEVRVLPSLMALQAVHMTANSLQGSPEANLGAQDIEALILGNHPGAQIHMLRLEQGAGLYHYFATFTLAPEGQFYAMTFDAQTGGVISYIIKQAAKADAGFIPLAEAMALAGEQPERGQLTDLTFTRREDGYAYQLTYWQANQLLMVSIDAVSGKVLSVEPVMPAPMPEEALANMATPDAGAQPQAPVTARPPAPTKAPVPRPPVDRHDDDDDNDDDNDDDDDGGDDDDIGDDDD